MEYKVGTLVLIKEFYGGEASDYSEPIKPPEDFGDDEFPF